MQVKVEGLEQLSRELEVFQAAVASLGGELATLEFMPGDGASVDAAIAKVARAVDDKAARYRSNPFVADLAVQLKFAFEAQVRALAVEGG